MTSMPKIQLGSHIIFSGSSIDPYIIAEIGVNHEGSMDLAKRLVDLAKEGGAHGAKFQSYKAERLTVKFSPAYWDTSKEKTLSQYDLFKKYDSFDAEHYQELALHCKKIGIDFLSTPFDLEAIDYLESLVPFYKIASADLTCTPLLRRIASKKKPVLLSTGCATLVEIEQAIQTLKTASCKEIILLHCILNYPCEDKNANLEMIYSLKRTFPEYPIGYSDHTLPDQSMFVLTQAATMGACVIEKHFTHDKSLLGNDHYHAMDIDDLKTLVKNVKRLQLLKGADHKKPIVTEMNSREQARRSIVLANSCKQGSTIRESDITFKRPGHGISPLFWDEVIGKKILIDLEEDHILQWGDV